MNTAIEADAHFFPAISILANEYFDPERGGSMIAELSVTVAPAEGSGRHYCEARIKVERELNPASPYFIDVACASFVTVDVALTKEAREQALERYAYTVLFPAIKELVLSLTARQSWGPHAIGFADEFPSEELPIKRKPRRAKATKKAGSV